MSATMLAATWYTQKEVTPRTKTQWTREEVVRERLTALSNADLLTIDGFLEDQTMGSFIDEVVAVEDVTPEIRQQLIDGIVELLIRAVDEAAETAIVWDIQGGTLVNYVSYEYEDLATWDKVTVMLEVIARYPQFRRPLNVWPTSDLRIGV